MDGILLESLLPRRLRRSCRLWTAGMIAVAVSGQFLAAEQPSTPPLQPRPGHVRTAGGVAASARPASRADDRAPSRSPKVDHAVMPAGGMGAGQPRCSHCQRSACPQCRLPEPHHDGHSQCQHGLCPAHCPVRPDVFGFYGTRWRRWPGSGVVQASNNEAATPARPPRAEVPRAQEESIEPDAPAEAAAGDDESTGADAPMGADTPTGADKPAAVDDPAGADKPAAVDEPVGADAAAGEAASAVDSVDASGEDCEEPDQVVSNTAWRTFTAAPPRLAARP